MISARTSRYYLRCRLPEEARCGEMRQIEHGSCAPPESPHKSLTSCRTTAATISRYHRSCRLPKGAPWDEMRQS